MTDLDRTEKIARAESMRSDAQALRREGRQREARELEQQAYEVFPPCACWNEGQYGRVHREDCPIHGPEQPKPYRRPPRRHREKVRNRIEKLRELLSPWDGIEERTRAEGYGDFPRPSRTQVRFIREEALRLAGDLERILDQMDESTNIVDTDHRSEQ
jgi:hypothetical protein